MPTNKITVLVVGKSVNVFLKCYRTHVSKSVQLIDAVVRHDGWVR